MKFRIVKYGGCQYIAQTLKDDGTYTIIGSYNGYPSVEDAKHYCELFKLHVMGVVVDEFEL